MARTRFGWGGALLNVALVAGGLVVGVLLYGLASRTLTPRAVPVRAEAAADTLGLGPRVRVEVRNASTRDGLARRASEHLRRRGFDVIGMDTAPAQDTTALLVRRGTLTDGRHVAGALGLPARSVGLDTAGAALYDPDVSVRLGRDYPARAPFDL